MPDLEDVLADIPSRGICDNLVARFFLVGEPSTGTEHPSTSVERQLTVISNVSRTELPTTSMR